MQNKINRVTKFLVSCLASTKFFWVAIAIFIFEAVWIALSFRYALLYDERYHYMLTQLFANHYWPVISNQPPEYDFFSNISRSGSYTYHYLMSFPFRVIDGLIDNKTVPIIFLRLLNIALFTTGILVFYKLFKILKIRQIYINVGLLFFVLLPIVPFVAAHINYDNAVFLLSALFFYFSVKTILNRKINIADLIWLLIISLFGILVKFSFVAFVVPGLLILAVILLKRYKSNVIHHLRAGIKKSNKKVLVATSLIIGILILWLGNIYFVNLIRYGDPTPPCKITMSVERCAANSNNNRNQRLVDTKNERNREPIPVFSMLWLNNLLTNVSWTGVKHTRVPKDVADPFPIFNTTLYFSCLVSLIAIAYSWRALFRATTFKYLFSIIGFVIFMLYLQNMFTYNNVHLLVAVQPRYLLPVGLMIIVFSAMALSHMVGKNQLLKIGVFFVILLGFVNGGGLAPHILKSQDSWYWESQKIIDMNHIFKSKLDPMVTGGDVKCYDAGRYLCD